MVKIDSKVGEKGQIVIPKPFREEYGILPGDQLSFVETKEGILIRKRESIVELARSIAKSRMKKAVSYEGEIEKRWKRASKGYM